MARIKAPSLIRFLGRLIQDASGKVFLIWDNLPVHRARAVRDWLAERTEQIEVFYLPSYSPELNPDEGLNADLKQAVTRKPPARSKPELKRAVISHMRRLVKAARPDPQLLRASNFPLCRVVQDHPSRINNFDRVAILRTASNFDREGSGQTPVESLTAKSGGYIPSVTNAWRVGAKFAHTIVADWQNWSAGVPK